MKYIIFEQFDEELPILFPSTVQHAALAEKLKTLSMKPISAGFLRSDPFGTGIACYGDSMTLNIKSRGERDADIINNFLGLE